MVRIRRAAVAGTFYPSDPDELTSLVTEFTSERVPTPVFGAIVPHAGLAYSGACAGKVYAYLQIPRLAIILAPNHTGRSRDPTRAGYWSNGAFQTPLGNCEIDGDFLTALRQRCDLVSEDEPQHLGEHAIEVQLPFIQVLSPDTLIAPIVLPWTDWPRCRLLAEALAVVIKEWGGDVLLLASSDMNHFESADTALYKDTTVLEAIAKLDGEELLGVCDRMQVTMCGRAPAAVVTTASKILGAEIATVLDYRHSGMVTGDNSNVVSYAGIVMT